MPEDDVKSSHGPRSFDDLVQEAVSAPVQGWDFSFLRGRAEHGPLPWSYRRMAGEMVANARRVCDVDTGGGELFSSLRPPRGSVAVEPHPPSVPIAAARLQPLGVTVLPRMADPLPLDDAAVDLVLNSHGYLQLSETYRVLSPGGWLLTQQVGAQNDTEFNEALGIPASPHPAALDSVAAVVEDLQALGFVVSEAREAWVTVRYLDIGAVVFQLRMVPWQAPGFDPEVHRSRLQRIHSRILDEGGFSVRSQRFLIQARKC